MADKKEKVRNELISGLRRAHNAREMLSGDQRTKSIRNIQKFHPEEVKEIQDENTDVMNKLYNELAFNSEYYNDPASQYALEDAEFRTTIPLGHEKSQSLGARKGRTTRLYGLNERTVEDRLAGKRGQVYLGAEPMGNPRNRLPVVRHEGMHDLRLDEDHIRALDNAYATLDGRKNFSRLASQDVSPSEKANLLWMLSKRKAQLGKFYNRSDELETTRNKENISVQDVSKIPPEEYINLTRAAVHPKSGVTTSPSRGYARIYRDLPDQGWLDKSRKNYRVFKQFIEDLYKDSK